MADQRSTIVKIPPHDSTAEKAVLGSMLIDSAALSDVAETLRPKHFYFRENRVIYEAILRLFDKSVPIDAVTVGDELKDTGDSKTVGGQEYLTELIDIVPTSAYVKHYADIVKNMYIKRTIISIGSSLVEEAFEEGGDVTELLGKAESEIFSISQAFLHRDLNHLQPLTPN